MFCSVNSAGLRGLEGYLVQAECFVDRGMFELAIIGLPDASVSEAQGRIQAVRANCGLPFKNGRTTISLAPTWLCWWPF